MHDCHTLVAISTSVLPKDEKVCEIVEVPTGWFSLSLNLGFVFLGLRISTIAWCAVGNPGLLSFVLPIRFSPLYVLGRMVKRDPPDIVQYFYKY